MREKGFRVPARHHHEKEFCRYQHARSFILHTSISCHNVRLQHAMLILFRPSDYVNLSPISHNSSITFTIFSLACYLKFTLFLCLSLSVSFSSISFTSHSLLRITYIQNRPNAEPLLFLLSLSYLCILLFYLDTLSCISILESLLILYREIKELSCAVPQ